MGELDSHWWRHVVAWLFRRRRRLKVRGNSMAPLLKEGDVVLVRKYRTDPVVGQIVVARHPFDTSVTLVKRIAEISDGRYRLIGDNPNDSTDSRSWGDVERDRILGEVVLRL